MSQLLGVGCWLVCVAAVLVRCRQIAREREERAARRLAALAVVEWCSRDREERTIPLAGVPDRMPARVPDLYVCEQLYALPARPGRDAREHYAALRRELAAIRELPVVVPPHERRAR